MPSIDLEIIQLLIDCDCVRYASKFAGMTKEKLLKYNLEDLKQLLSSLSKDKDKSLVAQKIFDIIEIEKIKSKRDQDQDEVTILHVVTNEGEQFPIKEEQVDTDDLDMDMTTESDSENDLEEWMDAFSQVQDEEDNLGSTSSLHQNLNLENGSAAQKNSHSPSPRSRSPSPIPNFTNSSASKVILDPWEPRKGFRALKNSLNGFIQIAYTPTNLSKHELALNIHSCNRHDPPCIKQNWMSKLDKWGSHIEALEMPFWTWGKTSSSCPYNLQKLLIQFPNLEFLKLNAEHYDLIPPINVITLTSSWSSEKQILKLSHLKILQISNGIETKHLQMIFQFIIKAAINLEKIDYTFGSWRSIDYFLKILQNCQQDDQDHFNHLKSLTIKSFNEKDPLTRNHLIQLSNLTFKNLVDLELGHGIWDDVDAPIMERLFKKYSKIHKLTIRGFFKTDINSTITRHILIEIPSMPYLQYLNIGGDYKFASIFESHLGNEDQEDDDDQEPRSKLIKLNRPNLTHDEDNVKQFVVELKLNFMPRLKTLHLGSLFNLNHFHFATCPKLEEFRVGSRWDLAVKFPDENSRRAFYPLIKTLQLPDCLTDPSFGKVVRERFPELEKCFIGLATIRVLRSFFYWMANSKLTELCLTTQFDFGSTLDCALTDCPSLIKVDEGELRKVEQLKGYERWEDFIKFHHIEMPESDFGDLEGGEMRGVGALKNLEVLRLHHVPRTLRIPKGIFHWTSKHCRFTGNFIGFSKYQLSKEVEVKEEVKYIFRNYIVPYQVKPQEYNENSNVHIKPSMILPNFPTKTEASPVS